VCPKAHLPPISQVTLIAEDEGPKNCTCTCIDFLRIETHCPHTELLKKFETQFRNLPSPPTSLDVVPIRSLTRELLAYATLDHVQPACVRVRYSRDGRRLLTCTRNGHSCCSHIDAVLKYEKIDTTQVDVVVGREAANGDVDEEPHHYIKLFNGKSYTSCCHACILVH
jgi:hypothetical protein